LKLTSICAKGEKRVQKKEDIKKLFAHEKCGGGRALGRCEQLGKS